MDAYAYASEFEFEFDGFAQPGSAVWESLDAAGCDCHLPDHDSAPETGHGDAF